MRRKTPHASVSQQNSIDRSRQIFKEGKNKRQMSADNNSSSQSSSGSIIVSSSTTVKDNADNSGINQFICNNVDCLVDQGLTGIRRAVINGIDTISLTESLPIQQESRCTIL